MTRRSAISAGLLLAGSAILWNAYDALAQQSEWKVLFDGSNAND